MVIAKLKSTLPILQTMKRANNLIPLIVEPDNLRLALWKAQKGKKWSNAVRHYYDAGWQSGLLALRKEIASGEVSVGDYYFFTIFDPKEREICAPAFREQILHHALMNVCHEYFERKQIFDSYASRKGKGTYKALERAKYYTDKYSWYLKLDVKKFFANIQHEILKQQLDSLFKENVLLGIFRQIINSYEDTASRGVPIGNLSSQYFANHYLSAFDHWVKEELRCKAYIRYMDDMILWASTKTTLRDALKGIQTQMEQLSLVLKPAQLNQCQFGLPVLGYRVYPEQQVRLGKRAKRRFIKQIEDLDQAYAAGLLSEDSYQRRLQSLTAFTTHAQARAFRQKVLTASGHFDRF